MTSLNVTPGIILGGGSFGSSAGVGNLSQLQMAYQNLLSDAAGVASGTGARILNLTSGAIGTAGLIQIGNTETTDEVAKNKVVLQEIATFCNSNGIRINVQANLTNSATYGSGPDAINALVDQWATVAAAVDLPIASVEDVQEIGISQVSGSFANFASIEVNAVKTLIKDYATSGYNLNAKNLAVGDMEGGGESSTSVISRWWDAYDGAAAKAGIGGFSSVTTDTGWFAPWIANESIPTWQAGLRSISTLAAAYNMTMHVTVQGAETDTSADQFIRQAEQNAIELAKLQALGMVAVADITIQSWDSLPVSVNQISSPTSSTNEAAEIRAVYPLYESGLITAQGSFAVAAPGQIILGTGTKTSLSFPIAWGIAASGRLGVVLIDQTGTLMAIRHGSGTAQNLASNILVLTGDVTDLAAELKTITLNEGSAGPDTVDVETYGATGRLSDNQIGILAIRPGESFSNVISTNAAQGWISASTFLNTGTVVTSGSVITSETVYWSTAGTLASPVSGNSAFVKTIAVHEPLADYGVKSVSKSLLGTGTDRIVDFYDPNKDNGAFPANGYANNPGVNNVSLSGLAGWLPNAFNPTTHVMPLVVKSTVKVFNPLTGALTKSTDILASNPVTVVDKSGTHPDIYATLFENGGSQVTEYNTGDNPEWQNGWGSQFSSAALTYDDSGRLVEEFLQGGATNPWFTIDDVFNPTNGRLWESFQSTTPPPVASNTINYATTSNPYQPGFATGPLYVTEFNTGDNPDWNYVDWGNSTSSDTEVWTDYMVLQNFPGFALNFPVQYTGALNAYPLQFVNGETLDLINLPGTINVNLNALQTLIINSQKVTSGLSGLNTIDAAGATGAVTITGSRGGGSTLIGGNSTTTIIAFGHDMILVGAGTTTITTGSGGSAVQVSGTAATVVVNGNGNSITAGAGDVVTVHGQSNTLTGTGVSLITDIAGTSLTVNGDRNTVATAAGNVINVTGAGDTLTFLKGGTLNLNSATSAATATGNNITAWMDVNGGTLTIMGDDNRITGGNNADVVLTGDGNVTGLRTGGNVTIIGHNDIVSGTGISINVANAASIATVVGGGNLITAASGSTVRLSGVGDVVNASGATISTTTANDNVAIHGANDTVSAVAGSTVAISGIGAMFTGSNAMISVGDATSLSIKGVNNKVTFAPNKSGVGVNLASAGISLTISGSAALYATATTIGATISCSAGSSALHVQGGGSVTMGSGIRGIQKVFLDDGPSPYNFVANSTLGMNMQCGANNAVVTVGAASQSVSGGSGSVRVLATAGNAGVAVTGGSGGTILEITTGGTVSLNAADRNLAVILDASAKLNLSKLSFITAVGAAAGHDTITAGGQGQILQSIGGNDTLIGSSSFGDTFLGTVTGLLGDTIKNFGGSDVIDVSDLKFATLKPLTFGGSSGVLTVADATHSLKLTLGSGYASSAFAMANDGHGGTLFRFVGH